MSTKELLTDGSLEEFITHVGKLWKKQNDLQNNNSDILDTPYQGDAAKVLEHKSNQLLMELERLENISVAEIKSLYNHHYATLKLERNNKLQSIKKLKIKYEQKLLELDDWNPKDPSYQAVKDYCKEMIESLINKDCNESVLCPEIKVLPVDEWYQDKKKSYPRNS